MRERVAESCASIWRQRLEVSSVSSGLQVLSGRGPRPGHEKRSAANHPDIEVLAVGDGEWISDRRSRPWKTFLTSFPDIDAVSCPLPEESPGGALAIARARPLRDGILPLHVRRVERRVQHRYAPDLPADGKYTPFHRRYRTSAQLSIPRCAWDPAGEP